MHFNHLKYSITLVLFFIAGNAFSQYVRYTEDTAKVGFGLGAKTGMIYDYPFFHNRSSPSFIGEIDFYVMLDKIQFNTGVGLFANNSVWHQGSDQYNPEKNGTTQALNFFIPLNADFRLFNIKRNLFFLKLGFNFLLSANAYVTETPVNTGTTISYQYPKSVFGLGGYLGLKYSRNIGEHILLSFEMDLNLGLSPLPSAMLGNDYSSGYNMISRHPNGDFKISFQYILGKKHINLLDPSKKRKKKQDGDVIDEE